MTAGFDLGVQKAGRGVARLVVRPEHLNFLEVTHGGVVFGVAVAAARDLTDGRLFDCHLLLTGRSGLGDTLLATATLVTEGRTLSGVRVEVRRDDGRLVGVLQGELIRGSR